MAREIIANEPDSAKRRIFFDIRQLDGLAPALTEDGGQPQITINGTGGWASNGVSTLTNIGQGRYYAEVDQQLILNIGDVIESRYKSNNTVETPGETLIVIATPPIIMGGAEGQLIVDSYASIDEADFYFNNRLNSKIWFNTDEQTKQNSLTQATRSIDRLNFIGDKTDPNQFLEFPRTDIPWIPDSSIIPSDIKIATCEIAIMFLSGVDIEQEMYNLYVTSRSFVTSKTTYDRKYIPEHLAAGIVSSVAWTYLQPYLASTTSRVDLTRVN